MFSSNNMRIDVLFYIFMIVRDAFHCGRILPYISGWCFMALPVS